MRRVRGEHNGACGAIKMRDGAGCVPAISKRASQPERERVLNVEVTVTYFGEKYSVRAKRRYTSVSFPGPEAHTEHSSAAEFTMKKYGWGHVGKPKRCSTSPGWGRSPRPRQLSHRGAADQKKKREKNSAQITQARPSLDAFVIASAALPRKEKTKKKSLSDDAEE